MKIKIWIFSLILIFFGKCFNSKITLDNKTDKNISITVKSSAVCDKRKKNQPDARSHDYEIHKNQKIEIDLKSVCFCKGDFVSNRNCCYEKIIVNNNKYAGKDPSWDANPYNDARCKDQTFYIRKKGQEITVTPW